MIRKRLLERYASADDGRIAIDMAVPAVEDLYYNFERATPFPKKDLNDEFADYPSIRRARSASIMLEGLTIAAWVALWEAVANLLVHWGPHHRNIRVYRRLSGTEFIFRETFNKAGIR